VNRRNEPTPVATARGDAAAEIAVKEPLFSGLGGYHRTVTTRVPEAQRFVDQGLSFLYAFNHDEAIRSFRKAAELDPSCVPAFWGIAMANGPHINNPAVDEAHAGAAIDALAKARAIALEDPARVTPVERALIDAVGVRFPRNAEAVVTSKDRAPFDRAFAVAMKTVWESAPADADVGAIYAEALMDLRPWDLWTQDGHPQPGTELVVATLEKVLELAPDHPLANHLYVHAMEASPTPEKAERAADRLRTLQPGLGHMLHMPSHIDVRRGRWAEAIATNERAIEADRTYAKLAAPQGMYAFYMSHDHHMLTYASMMSGESARAIAGVRAWQAALPPSVMHDEKARPFLDARLAMPLEVLVRFGRWDDVLGEPEVAGDFPIYRALRHAARGVAFAATNDVAAAAVEEEAFAEARAHVPAGAHVGRNDAGLFLGVAEKLLAGEILARKGQFGPAVAALEEAVRREDRLVYSEPPDWMHPVRHALGATLLKAHRAKEAEAVYRADLAKLPENGWSWIGLARSLKAQKKNAEAAEAEEHFKHVWAHADVTLSSSCFCQLGD
jgi:tetratricopeptide (TPR) repeat protein